MSYAAPAVGTLLQRFEVEVQSGLLRLFAKAIGETNPIYFDTDAARSAGYSDIVVPPTYLFCISESGPDPDGLYGMMGISPADILHAEQSIEMVHPLVAGSRVSVEARFVSAELKKEGQLLLLKTKSVISKNSDSVATLLCTIAVPRQRGNHGS